VIHHVYADLRRLAGRLFVGERPDHTLQPTALVNETYLKLVDQKQPHWQNRGQFLAVGARIMRRILVDHARRRNATKRVAVVGPVRIPEPGPDGLLDVLAIDRALGDLVRLDPRQAEIIELRFFGGLTTTETAEALGISTSTVKAEWRMARAWLAEQLRSG